MDKLLQGIPRTVCYLDDILVTGQTEEEHLQNLERVLDWLQSQGLRLKRRKCVLMVPRVEHLGHCIDSRGIHTREKNVAAVVNPPEPTTVQESCSFLGMVNYYERFLKDLATVARPLNQLLAKGVAWNWTTECRAALGSLKEQLASADVLTHYDVALPIRLACDASAYGLGEVIPHTMWDGSEQPVAYVSRTLTAAEKNYSQIEEEALALVFGVKKFRKFLHGRHFTLLTDNKALTCLRCLGLKVESLLWLLRAFSVGLYCYQGIVIHCNSSQPLSMCMLMLCLDCP